MSPWLDRVFANAPRLLEMLRRDLVAGDADAYQATGRTRSTLFEWQRTLGLGPIRCSDGTWWVPQHLRAGVDWKRIAARACRQHKRKRVATLLGVHPDTVRAWQRGGRVPGPEFRLTLWRLAQPGTEIVDESEKRTID